MSLPEGKKVGVISNRLKFALASGLLAAFAVLSAGCGWQPLYGPTASGADLTDVMRSVKISTVPGRVGQRVRNELIFLTRSGGEAGESRYRLDIAIRETVMNTMATSTGATEGQVYQLYTEFKLISLKTNKVVMRGHSNARAAFDKVDSVFADLRARRDAENRAAKTIAEAIRTRLAGYLSGNA
jgi:LPS-assembly lipoprotein